MPFLALLVSCTWTSLLNQENDNSLSSYACNITRHVLNNSKDLKDVIIVNFGGEICSSTVNKIAECAAREETPVTLIGNTNPAIEEKRLNKAAIVILTIGEK